MAKRSISLAAVLIATAGATTCLTAIPAAPALARPAHTTHGGVLSGTWRGYISRQTSTGTVRQKIVIEVNAAETRGTWQLGRACHGTLTLQSISSGYHHFLRHLAPGADCAGGDVDCLMPATGGIYDSVTSHIGSAYDESGTLRRVRA